MASVRTAAEALEMLEEFFSRDDVSPNEHAALWDILTALRGPDSGDVELKHQTTVYIRRQAFPKLLQMPFADLEPDQPEMPFADLRLLSARVPSHFFSHIRFAREALWHVGRRPDL